MDSSPLEIRLQECIAAYLQELDAGRTPDRAEWLAVHPDLADELVAFFADHDKMTQAAAPVRAILEDDCRETGSPACPAPAETFPQSFGDYELLEEIGRGGMGIVYKARQISLNRIVALKRIRAGQLASPEEVARFRREAQAAAGLDHPHIVPILEVGEHQGQHFFTMKLIEGGNLGGHLATFADAKASAELMIKIARAVHHAHQRGILHRDLKPGNILIDADGSPHVSDFGLAQPIEKEAKLTQSGAIVGTAEYMAPEQARGEKGLTTAADVYGLGAILYVLLTGRPPFQGDYNWETLKKVVEEEPRSPRSLNRKVDRDLETVCLKCLHKDPSRRYASAEDLAQDLDRCERGEAPLARPVTRRERLGKWVRKHPARTALVVATTALLAGGFYFTWRLREEIATVTKTGAELSELRDEAAVTKEDLGKLLIDTGEEKKKAGAVLEDFRWTKMTAQLRLAAAALTRDPALAFDLLHDYEHCPIAIRDPVWHLLHNACLDTRSTVALPSMEVFPHSRHYSDLPRFVIPSPDGRHLAATDWSANNWPRENTGVLLLHDLSSGRTILRKADEQKKDVDEYHMSTTNSAFSPDGKTLVFAVNQDNGDLFNPRLRSRVELVEVCSGKTLQVLKKLDTAVRSVAFSSDGKWIAAGTYDGAIHRWRGGDKSEKWEEIRDVFVDPEAARSPGNELLKDPEPGRRCTVAFTPDAKNLVAAALIYRGWKVLPEFVGRDEKDLKSHHYGSRWELLIRVQPLTGHKKPQNAVLYHYFEQFDQTNKSFNPLLAFTADSGTLAVTFARTAVFFYTLDPLELLPRSDKGTTHWGNRHFPYWEAMAISSDGKLFAAALVEELGYTNPIGLWDVPSGRYRGQLDMALPPGQLNAQGVTRCAVTHLGFDSAGSLIAYSNEARKVTWRLQGEVGARFPGDAKGSSALALSPDGTLLATASADHTITLCSFPDGKFKAKLQGQKERVTCLAFSHDGKTLASGCADKSVILWDLPKEKAELTLTGHKQPLKAVAFTRDDKFVIGCGNRLSRHGYCTFMWSAKTGELVEPGFNYLLRGFEGVEYHVSPLVVAVHPTLNRLATAWYGDAVSVWDDADTKPGEALENPKAKFRSRFDGRGFKFQIEGLRYSRDGKRILSWTQTNLEVRDVTDDRNFKLIMNHPIAEGGITCALFDHEARIVFVGTSDGRLRIWDVQQQERVALPAHKGAVEALVLSPDGQTLISAGADGLVRTLNLAPTRLQAVFRAFPPLVNDFGVRLDAEAHKAFVWDPRQGDSEKKMYDVNTGARLPDKTIIPIDRPAEPKSAALPDLKGWPFGLDLPKESRVQWKDRHVLPLLPDGESFYVLLGVTDLTGAAPRKWQVESWNLRTGKGRVTDTLKPGLDLLKGSEVREVHVLPDGETFCVLLGWQELLWQMESWNARTGKGRILVARADLLPQGRRWANGTIDNCLWAPDGLTLATVDDVHSDSGNQSAPTVRIFDTRTGKKDVIPIQVGSPYGWLSPCRFSSDGKLLFVVGGGLWGGTLESLRTEHGAIDCYPVCHNKMGNDGVVAVIDLEKKRQIPIAENFCPSIALDPLGKLLLLGDKHQRSRLVLWDRRTEKAIGVFDHPARVDCAGFSSDGRRLITRTPDHRVWVWNIPRPAERD